jgi:hypothetical protein
MHGPRRKKLVCREGPNHSWHDKQLWHNPTLNVECAIQLYDSHLQTTSIFLFFLTSMTNFNCACLCYES